MLKLWKNNHTLHVSKRNKSKNVTKLRHIQINHAFYSSIYPINNAVISLNHGFPDLVKRKISCQ